MPRPLSAALAAVAAAAAPAAAVDEPPYEIVASDGRVEVRSYAPMIVAEIDIDASEGAAPNAAFGPLFGYISGRNDGGAKIEMTAPVTQAPADGVKIDMTAPVTQAPAGGDAWTVAFVMPPEWTMDTLPAPRDPRVRLREVPARTVASLRYSGRSRPPKQAEKRAELDAWIAANGYVATGAAETAFYNAPMTPGPLRRNEILIPVRAAEDAAT